MKREFVEFVTRVVVAVFTWIAQIWRKSMSHFCSDLITIIQWAPHSKSKSHLNSLLLIYETEWKHDVAYAWAFFYCWWTVVHIRVLWSALNDMCVCCRDDANRQHTAICSLIPIERVFSCDVSFSLLCVIVVYKLLLKWPHRYVSRYVVEAIANCRRHRLAAMLCSAMKQMSN